MKKNLLLLAAALWAAGCLSACGSSSGKEQTEDSIQIVTTIFPEYDWVNVILGEHADRAQVTLLLDNGVDLHSYQSTAEDILKISTCDLFVYVGGESDEWVKDALQEAVNKDMVVLNLLDVLGDRAKEEELVEGMQAEDEEEGNAEEDAEEDAEEPELDEHVWLSLRNAAIFCDEIVRVLSRIDPDFADDYNENGERYKEQLAGLDAEYQNAVETSSVKTLLFGDRFPFRYLTDDYGLDYYAAFAGCSAETEASFETITFLSRKMEELSLSCIVTLEGTDHRIAETIAENAQVKDPKILTMDSMQSTTSSDIQKGAAYLSLMEKNLEVLQEALK